MYSFYVQGSLQIEPRIGTSKSCWDLTSCLSKGSMQLLQGEDRCLVALHRSNSLDRSLCRCDCCDCGNARQHRSATNGLLIEKSVLAARCIDDELNAIAFNQVNDVGPPLFYFENTFYNQACVLKNIGRALRGNKTETKMHVPASQIDCGWLVMVIYAEEHRSADRQDLSGGKLGLRKCLAKGCCHPHHFAS